MPADQVAPPNRETGCPLGSAPAIAFLIFLEFLVGAQAWLAHQDRFLTVSEMQERGVAQGLPFVWHLAMWSDFAIISPLAAYLLGWYGRRWSPVSILESLGIGLICTVFLHWLYVHSGMPEVHVHNHALTAAGWIHAVYMCIAFTIFLQFFLFTEDVAPSVLSVVSVLLLIHVFIGTHMLLGLINLVFPQPWYPAKPLRSPVGWANIAVLTGFLLWRNLRGRKARALYEQIKNSRSVKRAIAVVEFWTLQRVDTTEKYLKTLDYIASYVGFGWFLGVFMAKVQVATAFKGGIFIGANWISFVEDTALPCALIMLFGTVYAFSRHSVRLELLIGPKLFPHDRVPKNWGGSRDRAIIFFSVIGFLVLYIALTWVADNIKIASFIMLILACNDWRTRYLIETGMGNYFNDPEFMPRRDEKDYEAIMKRREVASRFLFEKPHLRKETGRVAGCGLSFLISMIGYWYSVSWPDFAAYFILITTIIVNEVITMRWRFEMYQELKGML